MLCSFHYSCMCIFIVEGGSPLIVDVLNLYAMEGCGPNTISCVIAEIWHDLVQNLAWIYQKENESIEVLHIITVNTKSQRLRIMPNLATFIMVYHGKHSVRFALLEGSHWKVHRLIVTVMGKGSCSM